MDSSLREWAGLDILFFPPFLTVSCKRHKFVNVTLYCMGLVFMCVHTFFGPVPLFRFFFGQFWRQRSANDFLSTIPLARPTMDSPCSHFGLSYTF